MHIPSVQSSGSENMRPKFEPEQQALPTSNISDGRSESKWRGILAGEGCIDTMSSAGSRVLHHGHDHP